MQEKSYFGLQGNENAQYLVKPVVRTIKKFKLQYPKCLVSTVNKAMQKNPKGFTITLYLLLLHRTGF